jgi:hypothetical protein
MQSHTTPTSNQSHTKLSSSSRIIFTGISKSKISTNLIKEYSQTKSQNLESKSSNLQKKKF